MLTRRQMLRMSALGGTAAVLAACQPTAPAPTAPTAPPTAQAAPTAAPAAPTAAAPVGATSAPTPPSAAAAPKPTAATAAVATTSTGRVPTGSVIYGLQPSVYVFYEGGYQPPAAAGAELWLAYDALTWIAGDGSIKPGLAKTWKALDDKTWEFVLGDWKFQNNRPVVAQDVVDTIKRYQDPANKLPAIGLVASIADVQAPDPKTVRISTKNVDATLPNTIANVFILPMQEVRAGGDRFFEAPFGTGAFKMLTYNSKTSGTFTAMGADWQTPRGVPRIKDITYKYISDAATQSAALRSGDVDVFYFFSKGPVDALQSAGLKVFNARSTATYSQSIDTFNAPTADVRVRQAINYAVDKQAIVDALYGAGQKPDSQLIQANALGYSPDVQPYPYDVARAKQLLAEAGLADGFTIPMTVTNGAPTLRSEIGEAIQPYLEKVGIKTDIRSVDLAAWIDAMTGSADKRPGLFAQYISYAATYEPNTAWNLYSSDTTIEKGRRWVDDQFDQMFQKAKGTIDRTERGKAYQAAGKYFHDQAPVLFMAPGSFIVVTSQNVDLGDPDWTWTADHYSKISKKSA